MNFLKKGPEIKLSGIKVPGFLQDVYFDLKDRHLLPLAVILLLAIIVVPFALSKSSSPESEPGSTTAGSDAGAETATVATNGELVAKSAPGLRDYRRRLDYLTQKNPFHQQYQRGEQSDETSASTSGESTVTTTEGSTSSGGTETETTTEFTTTHHITYYSYAIDVRVTTGGGAEESAAEEGGSGGDGKNVTVRKNLPELTMLPSREAAAVMYMGASKDGKKALMLVSSNVESIFGDAVCVLGSETCELLALEVGLPETFVYGGNGRRFTIELLETHLIESDKLHKAPLGKPHKHPEG